MSIRLRRFTAALAFAAVVAGSPLSALAGTLENYEDTSAVPVMLDITLLRPIGFFATVLGAVTYLAIAPFVAIIRPTDILKPLEPLVLVPGRYTWVDPLGTH